MSLLGGSVQPPLMTLLSSTSQPALSPLFTTHLDPAHPQDSSIEILQDAQGSRSNIPKTQYRGTLAHQVVHIQSPDLSGTYIQAGCSPTAYRSAKSKGKQVDMAPLGVESSWLGLHIRPLGRRDFAFEVGLVDARGRQGIVRISTFKKEPSVHSNRPTPLIHLPLTLPPRSSSTLTPWLHINVDLVKILPLFARLPRKHADSSRKRARREETETPGGTLGSVSYVRVYANCRVRRIWFSKDGEQTLEGLDRAGRDEFGLYAAEDAPR